jgi:hypothetical protein
MANVEKPLSVSELEDIYAPLSKCSELLDESSKIGICFRSESNSVDVDSLELQCFLSGHSPPSVGQAYLR